MYSFIFRKILYKTIHVKNFDEDNREFIHLFSDRFSIKQYISKILKKINENGFICLPKDPLSNNRYPKY